MKALLYDGRLRFVTDHPAPRLRPGWAVIRVALAGVCRTDLEITRGYMGFRGVLGHEFVGTVSECDDRGWLGRRVVGEINAACGSCEWCRMGLGRHCPNRSTLGIQGLDGCFAEFCALPAANLQACPDGMTDEQAVFVEPLSAACEILDQVPFSGAERCVVLGDGKLGILCAWVLSTAARDVTLVGRHAGKLETARWGSVRTALRAADAVPGADIVVEATGREEGLADAMALCRPRGTIVLKSTLASQGGLNLAPIVINEVTVVGSRCGRFEKGIEEWTAHGFPLERLVSALYPLERGEEAMAAAVGREALKVLLAP